ncbi:MAG: hypothetical protein FJY07_07330 [Bacteroidetes bacterium]|nr:hypothetical protein [Bacteroidota bacterium]
MVIERTKEEVIIRLPANVDTGDLQALLNYLRYMEITSGSKASQKDVDDLIRAVKKGRWSKNRNKLIS